MKTKKSGNQVIETLLTSMIVHLENTRFRLREEAQKNEYLGPTVHDLNERQAEAWTICVNTLYSLVDAGVLKENDVEQFLGKHRERLSNIGVEVVYNQSYKTKQLVLVEE